MSTIEEFKLYPTGLNALDQRLGSEMNEVNGIPGGSLIILHYPPTSDLGPLFATKIILNLIEQNQGSKGFYMHSSRPRHILEQQFKAYNWDIGSLANSGAWNWVDMWKITASHAAASSKIGQIDIRRKTYLKQAFSNMQRLKETSGTQCFSVVDNLLWLKEEDMDQRASKVLEFFKEILDYVFAIGGVHFFLLPKGILNEIAERLILNSATGIVDFKTELVGNDMKNHFSIAKMSGITFKSEILEITPSMDGGFRIESTGKV